MSKPLGEFYRGTGMCGRLAYCKPCWKIRVKKWKAANPEKVKLSNNKAYDSSESVRLRIADWGKSNPEKRRLTTTKWNRENPEKKKLAAKSWSSRNPDKIRSYVQAYQARKADAFVEMVDFEVVRHRDGGICGICHGRVDGKDESLDHVIPPSKGGKHCYANVQLAHRRCNSSKGNRLQTKPIPVA